MWGVAGVEENSRLIDTGQDVCAPVPTPVCVRVCVCVCVCVFGLVANDNNCI
jgi:hypothetical protein